MATRSLICIKKEDVYEVVYCHWDGYPKHNGAILKTFYRDPNKIQQLIDLGDISSLGSEIGEKHDFEDTSKNWTTFYGRDRDDANTDVNAMIIYDIADLKELAYSRSTEYVYIFENGNWKCYGYEWNEIKF